ncbi:MAG: class I SAM-dependent methyltransferase [Cyanothece sp. SIO1E1]|nr:class I SAM-dependent methyltransferase [Cyanothece sp. SIO1E1]
MNPNSSNPALCHLIAQQISASPDQRITFAEYMDLALYHPQHGYYTHDQVMLGKRGDYLTSSHLGADFGELLAEQFVQMWEILGHPCPFTLVEMGAGQGLLMQSILHYLHRCHPECSQALEYIIIEKSATLIAQQQQRLSGSHAWPNLKWFTWSEIPPNAWVGCCFSNELVDALPVHLITIESGQLQEIYVTTSPASNLLPDFVEIIAAPSTPELAKYFDLIGIDLSAAVYPEGYRSEINLAALNWLHTVANRLQRGYLLTIDYGYPATRYYSVARHQGTLQCYYQHTHHSDPYRNVGRQDLTAHVDFTALEQAGKRCGLDRVGFTQQGLFLMALGLGDRLSTLAKTKSGNPSTIEQALRRRDILHQLINPMGLGNFGVLIQSKGLSTAESGRSLKGLNIPPLNA